jgi:hypothetical protein
MNKHRRVDADENSLFGVVLVDGFLSFFVGPKSQSIRRDVEPNLVAWPRGRKQRVSTALAPTSADRDPDIPVLGTPGEVPEFLPPTFAVIRWRGRHVTHFAKRNVVRQSTNEHVRGSVSEADLEGRSIFVGSKNVFVFLSDGGTDSHGEEQLAGERCEEEERSFFLE